MHYNIYRKRGLPVGPAVVENTRMHIVRDRFKQSGCRWTKPSANNVLTAGCCIANLLWPKFFDWTN